MFAQKIILTVYITSAEQRSREAESICPSFFLFTLATGNAYTKGFFFLTETNRTSKFGCIPMRVSKTPSNHFNFVESLDVD